MQQLLTLTDGVVNFAAINPDIQAFLGPIMASLIGLAGLVSAFFIVIGGVQYTTSSGKPEKLEHAKKILRNALIGLTLVIAAGTLTSILNSAYSDPGAGIVENIPSLAPVDTDDSGGGITEILLKAIIGLFRHIIETAATPFINALDYFTNATPLMAENSSVMKIWIAIVGIANGLMVLALALLGFQVMSMASLGFEELDIKQLLPRAAVTFAVMNGSIFIIDMVIALSNAMITAVVTAFAGLNVWDALLSVVDEAGGQGLVALMIMVVFLILSVILLVYYVMRIVTLYVGAILSPLIALLAVVPGFRDFSLTAIKTYISTIFVLFVHVIILLLAATLFDGLRDNSPDAEQLYDPVMTMVIGVASLIALLKTQGVMMQMTYVSVGPKALRKLGSQFMNGVSYTTNKVKNARNLQTEKGFK